MRKLLISLMVVAGSSFAADLDMNNLYCGSMQINSATTLDALRKTCSVKSEYPVNCGRYLGLYEVKFINTVTNKEVKCDFPTKEDSALVNGCR